MKSSRERLGRRNCIEALERRVLLSSMYNIIDLGAGTVPSAINSSGQIVGKFNDNGQSGVFAHAFLYSNGAFTDLGKQLGPQLDSDAIGISESGHVVGNVMLTPGSDVPSGFFYNGSSFATYGAPGADYTTFNSVNNSDQIVGSTASGGGAGMAIYSVAGATPTLLSATAPAIGNVSTGKSINNAGQMVGEYFPSSNGGFVDHGYLLQGTTLTDLPGPALAVSQDGMIVGSQLVDQSSTNNIGAAYLDDNGTVANLGLLNGMATFAEGVNDNGQVVGSTSNSRAWLYSGGVLTDLNSLIPANSGWVLTTAVGINDKGQIIGYGNLNGAGHGFLLSGGLEIQIAHQTPVPNEARPGDKIHYTITAQAAPNTVQQVTIDDVIPAGTTLVAGSITGGGIAQSGAIDWSIANTPNISVSFDVKVNSPTDLPGAFTQVVDNATGEATFPGGQTSDASAQDVIPFKAQNGQITASGTIFHGFATQSLPQSQRTIATFTDSDPTLGAGSFSARINWGDKSITGAAIVADPAGGFDVVSDHKYPKPGDYSVIVTIKGPMKSSAAADSDGKIQQPLQVNSTTSDPLSGLSPQKSGWTGKQLPNGDLEVTLLSAIDQVNHDGGGKITFDIDPAQNNGSTTIISGGFDVTVPVTIDGTTQAGGMISIQENTLPGVLLPFGSTYNLTPVDCLTLSGGNSVVTGLNISGFTGWALVLRGKGGNRVSANLLGTDATGTMPEGDGVMLPGTAEGAPPTFTGGGMLIDESSRNTIGPGNLIAGNYAASSVSGEQVNVGGIDLQAQGNLSTGNVITGNMIGEGRNGQVLDPTGSNIILVNAPKNTIGGTKPAAGNTIIGGTEISLAGSACIANVIQGNQIGFDPLLNAGGGGIGITTQDGADKNTIGGPKGRGTPGNLISAGSTGIVLGTDYNVVQGNAITNNSITGVQVTGNHNLVGGTAAGAGNEIADNGSGFQSSGAATGGNGVTVQDGTGNSLLGNSIHGNYLLGIDLGNDGVTPDDNSLFSRSGANDLRNYPVLSGATVSAGKVTIKGTLESIPGKTYRVELFGSPAASPTGFGEGQVYLGSISVRLSLSGVDTFRATFALPANSAFITATATDSDGNTSEFSQAIGAV